MGSAASVQFQKRGPYVGWNRKLQHALNGILPGWALSVELPAPQSFRVSLEIGLAEAAVPFASPARTVKTLRRSGHLFRRRWLRAVFPLRDRAGKFDIGKAARSAMPS